MGIRYTGKVFHILNSMRTTITNSSMSDDDKENVIAMINACEQLTQAGHLVACGRTLSAFETRTGLSAAQMRATDAYKQIASLLVGDSAPITCPRLWFDFSRSLLKTENPNLRLRTKKTKDGGYMVTRLA